MLTFIMPSAFLTFSPDDINGALNIHASIPQSINREFPRESDGLFNGLVNQSRI